MGYKTSATELPTIKEVQIAEPSVERGTSPLTNGQHEDAPAVLPAAEGEEAESLPSSNVLGATQGNGQLSAAKMTLNLKDAEPVRLQDSARSKVLLVEDNIINMKVRIATSRSNGKRLTLF